jgi:HAD superfamily hydrolase (TIGR01509 family)
LARHPGDPVGREAGLSPTTISLDETDAWVFDLDGVLTDTASLHELSWTEVFQELFATTAARGDVPVPATFSGDDYRRLVDGEDRMDGVRNVLADRKIALPEGAPDEPAGYQSVWALAKEKDARYLVLLTKIGPRPFASSVELIRRLRTSGVDVAVVSASRHCAQVLDAAGLSDLVGVRVDGVTAELMGLSGKPDPAMFLEAVRRLGVEPARAAVVEDAIAGVQAAKRGGFRVVVGVARATEAEDLRQAGPDLVVGDLGELSLTGRGPRDSPWRLTYDDPDPGEEGLVESLCTLANGYLGSRGARAWARDDGASYPGTYLAGLYNRLQSQVAGQLVEVESLVNVPNWLPVSLRADDGSWLGEEGSVVSSHRIRLDLRCGLLVRHCEVTDRVGRRTAVVERRLVSMADPHLLALELSCVPLNWSGRLALRIGLDGRVVDDETVEDRLLANRHLELVDQGRDDGGGFWLRARTVQSQVTVAMAARCRISGTAQDPDWMHGGVPGSPEAQVTVTVEQGSRTTIEKVVSVFTSRDRAISEPALAARRAAADAPGFDDLLVAQRAAWEPLWHRGAVTVRDESGSSTVLDLHLFHLMQVASPHIVELDAGLGARGLHGEGYRGHVFWDASFAYPVLNLRFPAVSRALVAYRTRRLPEARRAAAEAGHQGAMFPWQSGSDGRDETSALLFNPRSGRWIPDRSRFERHVGLAVAYDAWQHWQVTGDLEFVAGPGAELVFEVARFFASMASWGDGLGRFSIAGVVGPDEFHDGYPWSDDPGVVDNAYTNVMAAWLLWRAGELFELLAAQHRSETAERLRVDGAEEARWDSISRGLNVPFHDGVISQFAGYEQLEPFDLDTYRDRYGNIGRLDLILDAEGDTVRRYQVGKQADVLMLLYLLSAEELRTLFGRMGYALEPETIRRTVDYYARRVTHGSTLSSVVHSWVLSRADRRGSWRYLQEAFTSDVADTQGGTTREGVHLGAMAGTVDILERCYTGMEVRDETLWFDPLLPDELAGLRFNVLFRGCEIAVDVEGRRLRLEAADGRANSVTVMVSGTPVVLHPGRVTEIDLEKTK